MALVHMGNYHSTLYVEQSDVAILHDNVDFIMVSHEFFFDIIEALLNCGVLPCNLWRVLAPAGWSKV